MQFGIGLLYEKLLESGGVGWGKVSTTTASYSVKVCISSSDFKGAQEVDLRLTLKVFFKTIW